MDERERHYWALMAALSWFAQRGDVESASALSVVVQRLGRELYPQKEVG